MKRGGAVSILNGIYNENNANQDVTNIKSKKIISIIAFIVSALLLIAAFMPISSMYIDDDYYLDMIMPDNTPRLDISISPVGAAALSASSLFKQFDDPYDAYYELEGIINELLDNSNDVLKELLKAEKWEDMSKESQSTVLTAVDIGGYFVIMASMMCRSTSVPVEVHITGVLSLIYVVFSLILFIYSIKMLIYSIKHNDEKASKSFNKCTKLITFILPLIILLCYLYSFSYMGIVSVLEEYLYLQPIALSSRITILGCLAIIGAIGFLIGILVLKLKKDKKSIPVAIKRGGAVSILTVLTLIFALSPVFKTQINVVPSGEKEEKEINISVSLPFFNTLGYYNDNMWNEGKEYQDKSDKEKYDLFDYISHEFTYYDLEKLTSSKGEHINTNLVRKLYFTHSGDFVKSAKWLAVSRIGLSLGALMLLWQNLIYLIYDRSSKVITLAAKGIILAFGILSVILQIGFTLLARAAASPYCGLGFGITFCYLGLITALFSIILSLLIKSKKLKAD